MASDDTYTIGRFEVIRSLGRGSQGSVYLARDPTLDRFVAVKVLTASAAELNSTGANGAPLEALITSKLNHRNIVPIYDAGECEIGPYLIFEFVEGDTLASVLKTRGPYPIEEAVPLFRAILDGLAAAHGAGVLHLDLSPRNILLDKDGVPRVMDFGLSQFVDVHPDSDGSAAGTLRYMSPEHFRGQPLGTWTDVFALGSTFFEIVTGQHAMQGSTLESIRGNILAATVDLGAIRSLPHGASFARFLAGAFERSREGRYADGAAMREAFELFVDDAGLRAQDGPAGSSHSTVEFLLRRMQRKQDFPTISATLADINRLTGDDVAASADKLANVILRDLALTSKLLKLVNSAFYGTRAAEITSISHAVVFLGVEQVRMTANSLMLFGHLKGDSAVLKDSMTKSFLSGLIARHLAQRARLAGAEEAFIGAMCQNLGENLVIYYFPDEFDEIETLKRTGGLDKTAASRGVLGVSYAELGAAVAGIWSLPASIIDAIRGLPPGAVPEPATETERMRDLSVFANELCDLFDDHAADAITDGIETLLERYSASVPLDVDYSLKLINAGFEKLRQYSQLFEIDVARSAYCKSVNVWLASRLDELEDDDRSPRPATAGQ